MERNARPRRRFEATSVEPTTLTEITRRYYACAVALAKAMGVPLTETFLQAHRESISCCFIEAGKAGVRLPPAVQLPPLVVEASVVSIHGPVAGRESMGSLDQPDDTIVTIVQDPEVPMVTHSNGQAPPPALTAADLPTRIPAGLQLPCAEALITDLRPPQLSLLIGKVGLKALADKSLEPLHVALLRERARRFEAGQRPEARGDVP